MTYCRARDAAVDEALAGLGRMDVAPCLAEGIRQRMHHQLARKTCRRVRQDRLIDLPHRIAAEAAVVAAFVLLYLAGVVRQALELYER